MATVDLTKMKIDIDKKFEKMSKTTARRIDSSGTYPIKKSTKSAKRKKK